MIWIKWGSLVQLGTYTYSLSDDNDSTADYYLILKHVILKPMNNIEIAFLNKVDA